MKVLHYKSNFLNRSETFIDRLIRNHSRYEPVAMCIEKKHFTDHLPVFQQPQSGLPKMVNTLCFHLNLSLPFYRKVIEEQSPDIIHAHFGYDGFRMYRVAQKTETPLVVSFYGSDVSRLPTELGWPRRYRKLAQHAQKFVAASELMKSQLVDLGFPKDDIQIIRFGINIEKFCFKNGFNPKNRLMMVGRMVEKKGFKYALQTIHLLKNRENRIVYLDLYGDGPLRENLKKQCRELGVDDQVQFHGYVSNTRVRDELQKHSLLLAPSVTASDDDKEGLPNTVLEAMASGVPVIGSDHAAIPEAVHHKETGFLVPEKEPKSMASAVAEILDGNQDIETIRHNARTLIEEQYSVEQLVKNTEDLYTQIIDSYAEK